MSFLILGGAGYIGSHIAYELLKKGNDVVIADNFSNSSEDIINTLKKATFVKADIRNEDDMKHLFIKHPFIRHVIHCAGLKSVSESQTNPLDYYENNVAGTIVLLKLMQQHKIWNLVFSSSATVCIPCIQ